MDRREQMRRWLALREEQGLTFRQLSERTGVAAGTLGSWAWKLRGEATAGRRRRGSAPSFVELIPSVSAEREEPRAGEGIEIVLGRGRRILVRGEVDETLLLRVVRALERC
jgi:transcriptional regulator with XRE-family HTH domain